MLTNYYILRRVMDEWQKECLPVRVVDVYCQQKDVLTIGWVSEERESGHLEISIHTKTPYVCRRPHRKRRNRNSADLFQQTLRHRIERITMRAEDRRICVHLSSGHSWIVQMYGSMNVFLVDADSMVLESFKDSRIWEGRQLSEAARDESWKSKETFAARFPDVSAVENALSHGMAGFHRALATEFGWRHRKGTNSVYAALTEFLDEMAESKPRLYFRRDEPILLSPVALTHLETKYEEIKEIVLDTYNDAVTRYLEERWAFDARNARRMAVLRVVRHRLRRNRALRRRLEDDRLKNDEYVIEEKRANLLAIEVSRIRRGMDSIACKDIYENNEPICIGLDPRLSPQENIARRYRRARKMKEALIHIARRLDELSGEQQDLEDALRRLDVVSDIPWEEVERLHGDFLRKGFLQTEAEPAEPESVFREYRVFGEWRVFVGQNDAKNDQLTFRFAKKDDLWFHARDVPGSHVVLKKDGRRDNPSKRSLEEAASIAAHFSKSRTSALVPVIMTEKKYVRKRKGAAPGKVVVERETVLIVEPREADWRVDGSN